MKDEICTKCNRIIGPKEQAYVYDNNVVCERCYKGRVSVYSTKSDSPKSSSPSHEPAKIDRKQHQQSSKTRVACPNCHEINTLTKASFCICGNYLFTGGPELEKAISECMNLPKRGDRSAKLLMTGKWLGFGILALVGGVAILGLAIVDIYDPRVRVPGTLFMLIGGILAIIFSAICLPRSLFALVLPLSPDEFVWFLKWKNIFIKSNLISELESYLIPSQRSEAVEYYRILHDALKMDEHKLFCFASSFTLYKSGNIGTVTICIHEGTKKEHKSYAQLGFVVSRSDKHEWYLVLPNLTSPDTWILKYPQTTHKHRGKEGEIADKICDAARKGWIRDVKLMLEKNPELMNAEDSCANPLLACAAYEGRAKMVELLIAKGANVNIKGSDGDTPLHYVAFGAFKTDPSPSDYTKVAQILINNGADVNAKCADGSSPLHRAVIGGNNEIAKLFINKGSNLNAMNNKGDTPLHLAAKGGNIDLATFLISNGAQVNARNENNATPREIAVLKGHKKMADWLRKNGGV